MNKDSKNYQMPVVIGFKTISRHDTHQGKRIFFRWWGLLLADPVQIFWLFATAHY